MKENVVVSFLKCFKHVQNTFSTSLDRLCSTIKSPFFVPSSSSSASKHTTNGQLTEIDSHCTTLHTDSTNHNIPWKWQPASAAQAPFSCLREALRQFIPWCPLWCPISAMLWLIQNFPREMKPSLRFWHGIIELRNALQASRCGMICRDVHNRDSLCYFHSHMLPLVLICRTWHAWLVRKHSNCSQAVKMQLQFIYWHWQIFNPGLLKFSSIIVIILCKWSARWRSGTKSCRKYLLQHQVMLSHAVSSTSSDSGSLTFSFTTFSSWKRRIQQRLDGNFEKFHHGISDILYFKYQRWNVKQGHGYHCCCAVSVKHDTGAHCLSSLGVYGLSRIWEQIRSAQAFCLAAKDCKGMQ